MNTVNTLSNQLGTANRGRRTEYVSLSVILLGAIILRLPSIYGNLPDIYWHDELNFIEGALRIGAGEIKGGSFGALGGYGHGTLTYYVMFAAFGLWFAAGRLTGVITGLDGFVLDYVTDPTPLFLVTHTVMLVAGVGTVWLTYLVGRRLFDVKVGLLAALLIAVSFQSVHMTYGKEDGIFTFLILLSFYAAIGILERPERPFGYLLTGAILGAATAVKYFGLVGLVILVVAAWRSEPPRWTIAFRNFCVGLGAFVGSFVCLMPAVFLDTGPFIRSFLTLAEGGTGILMAETIASGEWYGYLWTTYAATGGVVLTGMFYGGVLLCLWERTSKELLLLVYPLALTLSLTAMVAFGKGIPAPHYQLSTAPFLCVAAGRLLEKLGESWRSARWAVAVFVIIAAAGNVADALRFHRLVHAEDSRMVARKWVETHVPEGASVLVEGAIFTFVLEGPQLRESRIALERDLKEIKVGGGSGRLWEAKLRALAIGVPRSPTYDLHKVYNVTEKDLRKVRPDYVVVRNERGRKIMDEEKQTYRLVFDIQPDSSQFFKLMPMLSVADMRRLRQMPLVGGSLPPLMPGPAIWIYRSAQSSDAVPDRRTRAILINST